MGPMKPKDAEKLRKIVQATYALVQQRGLAALTLAEIARAAGIATSTLYIYFDSKQALLDQLYQDAKTATFDRLVAGAAPTLPLKARVRSIWLNMLANRLANPAEIIFMEQYTSSQFMSEANRELGGRLSGFFHAILKSGQEDESLKAVPLPFLMALFLGSVQETARLVRQNVLADDEQTRATGFLLCWDAIKA
jgi:TetR/AcrR family transcriptional repressor of multidrug resistance operon